MRKVITSSNLLRNLAFRNTPFTPPDTGHPSQSLKITPTHRLPSIAKLQQHMQPVEKQETFQPESNLSPVFDSNISAMKNFYLYDTLRQVEGHANKLNDRDIQCSIIEASLFNYYEKPKIKITKLGEYNHHNYTYNTVTFDTKPSPLITKNQYILIIKPTKIYIKKQENNTYLELTFTS